MIKIKIVGNNKRIEILKNRSKQMKKITVIIPTHNEENQIVETLDSIFNQTMEVDRVITVCDNCTDNTVPILEKYENEKLEIFITKDNKGRKAGALNQCFRSLDIGGYILVMDADTVLDENCILEGAKRLDSDVMLGAVCSRAGILPYTGKGFFKKVLWHLQHIEYGQFDAHRMETEGKIKVVHGMATIFRSDALKSVIKYRKEAFGIDTDVYLENNLVEDYEVTLCLKHNWRVATELKMMAWTEVPLSTKELYVQRLRWLRGGVDTLRLHGINKVTLADNLNNVLFGFIMVQRVIVFLGLILFLYMYRTFKMSMLVVLVIAYTYIDSFYRMKYTQNKTFKDYLLKLTFLPEIAYALFQVVILIQSFIYSFLNIEQVW